jgi:hypothetical protein
MPDYKGETTRRLKSPSDYIVALPPLLSAASPVTRGGSRPGQAFRGRGNAPLRGDSGLLFLFLAIGERATKVSRFDLDCRCLDEILARPGLVDSKFQQTMTSVLPRRFAAQAGLSTIASAATIFLAIFPVTQWVTMVWIT